MGKEKSLNSKADRRFASPIIMDNLVTKWNWCFVTQERPCLNFIWGERTNHHWVTFKGERGPSEVTLCRCYYEEKLLIFIFCLVNSDDPRFSHLNDTNKKLICISFSSVNIDYLVFFLIAFALIDHTQNFFKKSVSHKQHFES